MSKSDSVTTDGVMPDIPAVPPERPAADDEHGFHWSNQWLWYREAQIKRLRWLLRQVLNDLPNNKDWLDPMLEKQMRLESIEETP